jgi:hypothetical protein
VGQWASAPDDCVRAADEGSDYEKFKTSATGCHRVSVGPCIQQSYRCCVLRHDQRTGVALTAEVAAYDAYLIRVVRRERSVPSQFTV